METPTTTQSQLLQTGIVAVLDAKFLVTPVMDPAVVAVKVFSGEDHVALRDRARKALELVPKVRQS